MTSEWGESQARPQNHCQSALDPLDWEAFRKLAHAALDQAIDFVQTVRERPVWQPVPEPVRAALEQPLPTAPEDLGSVYREFTNFILPYTVGNIHPRFFGWVHGAGLASGIVAEMLAAALNANCGGRDHVGLYLERRVIEWCKSIFGFPAQASGILLSGTSMANLIGLAVAREAASTSGACGPLVAYASAEVHASVVKAAHILGFEDGALRKIPVTSDFAMDIAALKRVVKEDRAAGLRPFCVVGTAGTVNTGAFDNLESLADICQSEKLWLHVDGAFGALAILAGDLRARLSGIERADSLAFDFHKWMHVQYDAGCLLVRDGDKHRQAFSSSSRPVYLDRAGRGLAGGGEWPSDLGPELSRSFRALKVWFAFKEHGVRRFGDAISMNCRQARYLAGLLARLPNVEVLNPVSLNIVCFRFRTPEWDDETLDQLNEDIAADLQESGIAAPSTTRLQGRLAIRVNITNHRTCEADLELLVQAATDAANRRMPALQENNR
jgi:aromatic-L-amino-acid decarboxylase